MLVYMVMDGVGVPEDGTTRIDRVAVLLRRIADGDQRAFGRLYDLMSPRVLGLILAVVGDRAHSEDAMQEVFLETWRSASRFAASQTQGTEWVLAITRRRALEHVRSASPDGERIRKDAETTAFADGIHDAAPPLTMRSTLLTRIATMPQLPELDAAEAAAAEPVDRWPAPRQHVRGAPMGGEPAREPAPTTTMIQAVQRRNWTRGLLALAACLVLLVGLGFAAATINESVNRPPEEVALQQIEEAPDALSATIEFGESGSATAMWSDSVGKTVLISNGLPAIDADETFEVWFVRDDEPVSAGTFDANEHGGATALLDGTVESDDVIEVSVEPAGGSPTGAPTSDPFVTIPTS